MLYWTLVFLVIALIAGVLALHRRRRGGRRGREALVLSFSGSVCDFSGSASGPATKRCLGHESAGFTD
jgi:hypothetical protein